MGMNADKVCYKAGDVVGIALLMRFLATTNDCML